MKRLRSGQSRQIHFSNVIREIIAQTLFLALVFAASKLAAVGQTERLEDGATASLTAGSHKPTRKTQKMLIDADHPTSIGINDEKTGSLLPKSDRVFR